MLEGPEGWAGEGSITTVGSGKPTGVLTIMLCVGWGGGASVGPITMLGIMSLDCVIGEGGGVTHQ